jgi:predicted AlkP superfamily phosphohydrolase/phosphomutase
MSRAGRSGAPLLVVGLDGATLDLVRPWAADGRLPVLAGLLARGTWGRLRSTVPAATFPAWTSMVTGVNPGRHGVLDFTERVPGSYRVRFVNGSYRRVPALWTRLAAAGRRVVVLTVPATYPPEPVPGVMVSGFDSPLATGIDGSFVFPRAFHREIRRVVGRVPFADFQEVSTGPGWHEDALARLLDGVERRTKLTLHCLERERPDLLMVVFGESDTVSHHFWRFHDPESPRHAPSPFGDAIARVYGALDAALGRVIAAAPESAVAVVSDHGSGGASDRVVHLNRRLAACGLLGFRPGTGRVARFVRGAALRTVPHRLQGHVLRRARGAAGRLESASRFGNLDWARTVAYSEELDYHPSVWINLRGREPEGIVAPEAYEETRARVADALVDWRDEAGRPLVARIWRREELYTGAFSEGAPDLLLDLALDEGYSPSCLRSDGPGPALRRLAPDEHGAGKGSGMNGAHRRDGMFLLAGPGVRSAGDVGTADITDILPTLLAVGGESIPLGLDGRVIAGALTVEAALAPDALIASPAPRRPYDDAAEDEVVARLTALGYLEPSP